MSLDPALLEGQEVGAAGVGDAGGADGHEVEGGAAAGEAELAAGGVGELEGEVVGGAAFAFLDLCFAAAVEDDCCALAEGRVGVGGRGPKILRANTSF